jgi:signal transduction histidine kinase
MMPQPLASKAVRAYTIFEFTWTHYRIMATSTASQLADFAASGDFVQTLLDVSLTGFIVLRPVYETAEAAIQDFTYEHLNPAAQRMLWLPEHPAKTFLALYPTAQETGVFAFYCAVFASGQIRHYQVNYQHDAMEGTYHLVARRSGEHLVVSFTDTDDRQQMQFLNEQLAVMNEELTATNEELQASNEALQESNLRLSHTNSDLDNFIYTASHDLKAPISNIEGLLNLLPDMLAEAASLQGEVLPVLSRMLEAVERFKRTIDHLTDVSKLQAEFSHSVEAVRLADVIEDVRLDLLPEFTQAGAQLEVAVGDCQPHVFSPKNLRSIVYNLLSNALKYRHPNRLAYVRIRCATNRRSYLLEVQDNGLGLSEQQQQRLFQLFQRLHTHVEGTGVGLYMVKKIVENAGGTIAVRSEEGYGTTFSLVFPV